jgi:2'-hydroxyisoflavone reductase
LACFSAALSRRGCHGGHRVTVFNRGLARSTWPDGVEVVRSQLDRLPQRRWDAVIDTCGYLPGDVRASAVALRQRCARYLFVSTASAYAWCALLDNGTRGTFNATGPVSGCTWGALL